MKNSGMTMAPYVCMAFYASIHGNQENRGGLLQHGHPGSGHPEGSTRRARHIQNQWIVVQHGGTTDVAERPVGEQVRRLPPNCAANRLGKFESRSGAMRRQAFA